MNKEEQGRLKIPWQARFHYGSTERVIEGKKQDAVKDTTPRAQYNDYR